MAEFERKKMKNPKKAREIVETKLILFKKGQTLFSVDGSKFDCSDKFLRMLNRESRCLEYSRKTGMLTVRTIGKIMEPQKTTRKLPDYIKPLKKIAF